MCPVGGDSFKRCAYVMLPIGVRDVELDVEYATRQNEVCEANLILTRGEPAARIVDQRASRSNHRRGGIESYVGKLAAIGTEPLRQRAIAASVVDDRGAAPILDKPQ